MAAYFALAAAKRTNGLDADAGMPIIRRLPHHSMQKHAFLVLRVGLGITFLWMGALVLLHPSVWANVIQPWARIGLGVPLRPLITAAGVIDLIAGASFLLNLWTWVPALLVSLKLLLLLVMTGVTDATVAMVGLFFSSLAVFVQSAPAAVRRALRIGV
ncbi:MAG: hypothetical protein PHW10_04480 [Candidatus Peribacteraceae bacterium]|nr:hypothetical protein [Candidatus Peribacteraceae bacterium]